MYVIRKAASSTYVDVLVMRGKAVLDKKIDSLLLIYHTLKHRSFWMLGDHHDIVYYNRPDHTIYVRRLPMKKKR